MCTLDVTSYFAKRHIDNLNLCRIVSCVVISIASICDRGGFRKQKDLSRSMDPSSGMEISTSLGCGRNGRHAAACRLTYLRIIRLIGGRQGSFRGRDYWEVDLPLARVELQTSYARLWAKCEFQGFCVLLL